MQEIEKPVYNDECRTVQFLRPDGQGQLTEGESITSCSVTCVEIAGSRTDRTADMIAEVAPYDNTQVKYWLRGGVSGVNYILSVRVVTSNAQKLAEEFILRVK